MTEPDGGKELVGRILRKSLEQGSRVELEGLGTFVPTKGQRFRFIRQNRTRIFIAYVVEDLQHARKLYHGFVAVGFDPWLDKEKLLPGQNWPRAIETAIESADYFVACFSNRSVSKRGSFHSELRYALECAARVPLDESFLIPVRIEPCPVPVRITKNIEYVDLFPDWGTGFTTILRSIAEQEEIRRQKHLLLVS